MQTVTLYEAVADKIRIDFCNYMWYEDYNWYRIWESARVCNVNDQFRNVEDMYEVLKYQMKPDIVRERYDKTIEEKINSSLYSYRHNHRFNSLSHNHEENNYSI